MAVDKHNIYLATKIWFGKYKHKNKSIYQLLNEDLQYANWLLTVAMADKYIDQRVWDMLKYKQSKFTK